MPRTPFPFEDDTIATLAARMRSGEINASTLTRAYLDRIAALDGGETGLHSVIEVNPEAESIAAALDSERRAGAVRGPLHGIPLLVKDNIETAGQMATSAGSLALAEHRAKADAFLVARLRAAGCVLLGKANLSEWANFRSLHSSSGWSARGGQCGNPYDLARNPSGSSSGSAAAVSANFCAVAVGTETDGSIVGPASACGVVGLKPTLGLISRAGLVPLSHSQDSAGPMTRSVADAALLLTAMTGVDRRDASTRDAAAHAEDYSRALDVGGLKGARLGVGRSFFGFDAAADAAMEEALAAMRSAGAELVDTDLSPGFDYLGDEISVLLTEFHAGIDAFLAGVDARLGVPNLAALIDFNVRHAAQEMPFFGQEFFEMALAKDGLDADEYRAARATCLRASRVEGIDRVLARDRLDAIVAPTGGAAWLTDPTHGDPLSGVSSSRPSAVAGYPLLTVPAAFVDGLPLGVSFIGGAWSEATLIRLGYAFEQLTRARRPPSL